MYRSTKQFPEFEGKNNQYSKACVKYVIKKEPILLRIFLYGIFTFLSFSILWHIFMDYTSVPDFVKENESAVYIFTLGVGFYVFLLVFINKYIHPAVRKHIAEFEANNRNA